MYLNSKLGNSPDHSKHIQNPPRRINANTEGYFCSFESSQSDSQHLRTQHWYKQKET